MQAEGPQPSKLHPVLPCSEGTWQGEASLQQALLEREGKEPGERCCTRKTGCDKVEHEGITTKTFQNPDKPGYLFQYTIFQKQIL